MAIKTNRGRESLLTIASGSAFAYMDCRSDAVKLFGSLLFLVVDVYFFGFRIRLPKVDRQ